MPISEIDLAEIVSRPGYRLSGAGSRKTRHGASKRPEQPVEAQKQPSSRPRKYRNQPVTVGNLHFDSTKEYRRYIELIVLEDAEEITDLKIHPKYDFIHNGVKIGSFKPDFSYHDKGKLVIEDVKSPITRKETSYRLRKKMMLAFHGLTVMET